MKAYVAKPYIGITGVTDRHQVEVLLKSAEELGWPDSHQLMIGALVSYKGLTLGAASNINRYISPDSLDRVFVGSKMALNLAHYNSRAAGLCAQLETILKPCKYADGVQLNVDWPRPDQLERLRERMFTRVVLQVSRRAYASVGQSPAALGRKLQDYCGVVDSVLFDPSGGQGVELDVDRSKEILEALTDSGLPMSWGLAGGLSADNIAILGPLLEIYPELSWDAESALRDEHDQLDLKKCLGFLTASAALLRQTKG
ncbi:MAG TPA: hypothetical protein VNA68_01375 [Candidatus Dormibacteraeota bacterium]|nr:hypothetical protein [Candidatus Dormibacteraeota bacterium]